MKIVWSHSKKYQSDQKFATPYSLICISLGLESGGKEGENNIIKILMNKEKFIVHTCILFLAGMIAAGVFFGTKHIYLQFVEFHERSVPRQTITQAETDEKKRDDCISRGFDYKYQEADFWHIRRIVCTK